MATIGTSLVAAMWSGPLSPPTNRAARVSNARRSASESDSPSTSARGRGAGPPARVEQHAVRGLAIRGPGGDEDPAVGAGRHQCRGELRKGRLRPATKRVARADVQHDRPRGVRDAQVREQGGQPGQRVGRGRHVDPVGRAIRWAIEGRVHGLEQVPLILDRMPRLVPPRAVHHVGVHPGSSGNIVAHPARRPAGPGQPGAARSAVEVDDQVEAPAAQGAGQLQVVAQAAPAAAAGNRDHVGQMRVGGHHRRGLRLDQVGQAGVGIALAHRPDDRGREDHVADQAEADEQDVQRTQPSIVASSINITGMSSLMG